MGENRKGTIIVVVVLLFVAIGLSLGIGLGLGLRRSLPRDDSNIEAPPGVGKMATKRMTTMIPTITTTTTTPTPTTEEPRLSSPYVKYRATATQSDAEECSKIGMDVLIRDKGTAVDAAVAILICVGLVQMQSTGIGGGHFMVIFDGNDVRTRLSREVLPLVGHENFFQNVSSLRGGKAIGVPGEVKGLRSAWELYGRVPWQRLLEPSIKLAEEGFRVSGHLAHAMKVVEEGIRSEKYLRELLVKPDGTLYQEGDILKRPKLARTLKTIAMDPESFYSGSLADDIVADIKERDGVITKQDMMNYETKDVSPIVGRLKNLNLTMYGPPPPSSGIIVQFILRILDGYNFTAADIMNTESAILTYQRMLETWKYAYARRASLGDASFEPLDSIINELMDESYIANTRNMIDDARTHEYNAYKPKFELRPDSGTSHLNVLAIDGSAVAITSSINTYFGSLVLGNRTGILFNNELDDFSVPGKRNFWGFLPSPSNFAKPGKMPMSSMSPTICLTDDNKVAFMAGAAGGSTIITSTAFVSFHNLYLGLDLGAAVDHPRFHNQLFPHETKYEPGWDQDILDGLIAKGHNFTGPAKALNFVGAIRNNCVTCQEDCEDHCIEAVSDGREMGGSPYGY